jgi:hypothetical protein
MPTRLYMEGALEYTDYACIRLSYPDKYQTLYDRENPEITASAGYRTLEASGRASTQPQ